MCQFITRAYSAQREELQGEIVLVTTENIFSSISKSEDQI